MNPCKKCGSTKIRNSRNPKNWRLVIKLCAVCDTRLPKEKTIIKRNKAAKELFDYMKHQQHKNEEFALHEDMLTHYLMFEPVRAACGSDERKIASTRKARVTCEDCLGKMKELGL